MTVGNVVDVRTVVVLLPLLVILHVTYGAGLDRIAKRLDHHTEVALYAAGFAASPMAWS